MKANTEKEIKKAIKKMKNEGIEFIDRADDLAANLLGIDDEVIKKENKRAFYFLNGIKTYIKK